MASNANERIASVFSETADGKFRPRGIVADYDPFTVNKFQK